MAIYDDPKVTDLLAEDLVAMDSNIEFKSNGVPYDAKSNTAINTGGIYKTNTATGVPISGSFYTQPAQPAQYTFPNYGGYNNYVDTQKLDEMIETNKQIGEKIDKLVEALGDLVEVMSRAAGI